jgi:hypothetical protein
VSWLDQNLDELAADPAISYLAGTSPAAEPTAIAMLALLAHDRSEAVRQAAGALRSMQQQDGAVGIRPGETPGWPTSFAVIGWTAVAKALPDLKPAVQSNIDRAVAWLLANRGRAVERSDNFGHNSELIGWAYAEGTHSWIEPTAMAVMALTVAGHRHHPATEEGIAVIRDRQLPGGGFNYGNTYVLGQLIRPHVQPTGIALLALSATAENAASITKSIAWVRRSVGAETTPVSLSWALLGLKAWGIEIPESGDWLAAAADRVRLRDQSPHKLALLTLAAKGWPT